MTRHPFNTAWTVKPKTSAFDASAGKAQSTTVNLPHDGMRDLVRDPDLLGGARTGFYPGGHLVYEKTFEAPKEWAGKAVSLEFEGVYRDATVYVNRDFAAQRPSGYAEFSVDLGPYLILGATNTVRVEARSHQDSRWYTGTGIHRDVWLRVSEQVHLETNGIRIATRDVDEAVAVVKVDITVRNESRSTRTLRVTSVVTDPSHVDVTESSAPLTLRPGEVATTHLRLYVPSPQLWNVDTPNLYRLDTSVTEEGRRLDASSDTFGIRTIQIDPQRGLRINGTPTKLRGGCIHHDNGPLGSRAIARAEERRVEILKSAGYNAIRSAHNPLSRPLLEACDRIGMLVIDELTDVWTEGKGAFDYSLAFPEWWERDLESMIAKDFNHPSVIMYSTGNEIYEVGRPIGSTWGRALAEKVRSLDNTRLVTNAINGLVSNGDLLRIPAGENTPKDVNSLISVMFEMMNQFGASEEVSRLTEEAHSHLDVSGVNYSEARYEVDAANYPNRVEYGSETFPGALDRLWALVKKYPHVIGDFAWTAWDYMGEAGVGRAVYADDPVQPTGISSPYPWLAANAGTIDITGFRRPISYWREIVWGLRHEPYIAVHRPQAFGRPLTVGPWAWDDVVSSWSWAVNTGSPVIVDVYSDADEIELLLNGQLIGRALVGAEKDYIARFTTTYEPGELAAIAYRGGAQVARTTLRSATGDTLFKVSADRTEIRADGTDLAYVEITLADSTGVLVNDEIAMPTVEVTGPGELLAFSSGQPDSEERFDAETRFTYDGRALAVIRPSAEGKIGVRVSAEGFAPVSLSINANNLAAAEDALLPAKE